MMEKNYSCVPTAYGLTGRLGQDRLSGVLESGAVRVRAWHPIAQRIASQAKIYNFY